MEAILYTKYAQNVKKLVQLNDFGKSAGYETIKRIRAGTEMRYRQISG